MLVLAQDDLEPIPAGIRPAHSLQYGGKIVRLEVPRFEAPRHRKRPSVWGVVSRSWTNFWSSLKEKSMASPQQKSAQDILADQAVAMATKAIAVLRSVIGGAYLIQWLETVLQKERAEMRAQIEGAGLSMPKSLLTSPVVEGGPMLRFLQAELERIAALQGPETRGAAAIAAMALRATVSSVDGEIIRADSHPIEKEMRAAQ
jgi:hypothetical protein